MKSFKVGDLVSVIDENLNGEVIKVTMHKVTILADDGFDYEFPSRKITHRFKDESADYFEGKTSKIIILKETEINIKTSKKHLQRGEIVIDLHIYELTEKYSHLSNYEMLCMQMDKVKEVLRNADRATTKKIIFIHGKGTGKLKQELEIYLTKNKYTFYAASLLKYSTGALAVEI